MPPRFWGRFKHGDAQLFVTGADVDVQLVAHGAGRAADGDGAAGADVGAVGLDLAGYGPVGGAGFDGGGEHRGRGASVQGAVGSSGVVVLGEDRQVAVERTERPVGAVGVFAGA
jgi:hypothetical protein